MVHGACIILMRHASIHRMNKKQWRDFKRRRANFALLMKNNEETSKEEEQTWLCWCLNKDILFLMCCSLLAASIYGLSRECRENLNIRCMRKWFWIKQAARKPRNSRSPVMTYLVFCFAYLVSCLAYLVFWFGYLVFVWCTWWLWHWDVVFLTFRIWDGLSNISITKNVQIFILWINLSKAVPFAFSVGKGTPAWKKYTTPGCEGCDNYQVWYYS